MVTVVAGCGGESVSVLTSYSSTASTSLAALEELARREHGWARVREFGEVGITPHEVSRVVDDHRGFGHFWP